MSSKMQEKTYQSQWKSVSDSIMGEGAQLWTPYNGDGSASESVSAVRAFLHQSMVIDKVISRRLTTKPKQAVIITSVYALSTTSNARRCPQRQIQRTWKGLVQTLDEGGASRALSRLSWAIPFPRSEFREKQHTSASQHVEVLDEYARQRFKFAKRCDLLVPNVGDILGGRFTMTKLRGWMLSDDSRRIDEDCERLICDYIFVMDPATDLSSVDDLADFSSLADVTSGLCLIPSQQVSTVRFMLKGTYNLQHCLLLYSIG
ncbi:hypothetical protein EDD15DRAFT_2206544 [Pisolithus albus]|nr:hypothetical protein EDD15DRAFT_2206544 [Pisolithus albus]